MSKQHTTECSFARVHEADKVSQSVPTKRLFVATR